ncbi:MAG TPA: ABC transporter permease [Puia sp.]|nr:ABC transporter permease [Puia sp.]
MYKNYLKIAFRNLWKSKGFSAINITGLSLGMACSLLILLWVKDERSVGAGHENGARLYYVYEKNYLGGKLESWYWTQGPLAEQLKKEIPEIQQATAISWPRTNTFSAGDKTIKEDGYSAGADFFTMFSYPLLQGVAKDALSTPSSMAVSRKMANDFFGSPAAAIGKTIRFENKKDFTVKAVFEDLPSTVADKFNYMISWTAYLEDNHWAEDWGGVDPRTIVLIRPDASGTQVEKKLTHFLDKFNTELKGSSRIELALQRFDQAYLHSEFKNGRPEAGRITYVRLFSTIALFILLIACINFMNLTTARSLRRAREIGVRKVMGARRGLLIRQFIGEAVMLTFMAAIPALILTAIALPAFNQLTGKQIIIPYAQWAFWGSILGITLVTGIFSGSYPAFFLSAFNPIKVLKGSLRAGSGSVWFRKGLVVFQFVLSIILIVSTIMISRQISFVQNADLGYDRENLLYIPVEGDLGPKLDVFTAEARRLPGIAAISELTEDPTEMGNGILSLGWEGKDPKSHVRFIHDAVGPGFIKLMKLKMATGKDFFSDYSSDSMALLINETAQATMGYKDPIGKPVFFGSQRGHIVGVVKDFHFRSMHDAIQPLVLMPGKPAWFSTILVRTQAGKTKDALAGLEQLCKQLNPKFPFSYKFSDQEYAKLYKSDEVTGRLSVIFAVLAIFISCLGLLGLSIFTASQRAREVGIRKVLGAGMGSLFNLLSKEFLILVAVAFAIAAPLGWWAMHEWLQQFAYRTDIPLWTFGLSGVLALVIALLTVCFQAFKTAGSNPVESLRSE